MNYIKEIEQFIPYNEEEEKEKELMLKYIKLFDNILDRECEIGHFSSSCFAVNPTRDKIIMAYHNIYQSWAWAGGHADGEEDLQQVALRELEEETGVKHPKLIQDTLFSLEILPVWGHQKNGIYIPPHQHLNVTYLMEVSENEVLRIKKDENSGVKWIPIDEMEKYSKETHMYPIYDKIKEKMRKLK